MMVQQSVPAILVFDGIATEDRGRAWVFRRGGDVAELLPFESPEGVGLTFPLP